MTRIPADFGPIHFIGIGGIGMSGIAELLIAAGHRIQGSDLKESAMTERLRALGATVFIGHCGANIAGARLVVRSSAIAADNAELQAARRQGVQVIRRADMLVELMRMRKCVAVAGTHGKTTTTSLTAALLDAAGHDPMVVNGGIIQSYGSNARFGSGEWLVAEADESDGTFLKLPATVAIVTNIDPEHMDHYGNFTALREAFFAFLSGIPFYGAAVCCIDHPEVQALAGRLQDRKVIRYGFSPQADIGAINLRASPDGMAFDLVCRKGGKETIWPSMAISMPGRHNVLNALAAIAVARHLGVGESVLRKGLEGFSGVARRFSHVGAWMGVTIIDDYGHHPAEIAASLNAARAVAGEGGRVIAIHEPHRYTRLSQLFDRFCRCFNDADIVAIAPVYPAGEAPIEGASRDALVEGVAAHGHRAVRAIGGGGDLPAFVAREARAGDVVICLGAGAISEWAQRLESDLGALCGRT